jgi:membrane protease YdiL (CAAX protease family)
MKVARDGFHGGLRSCFERHQIGLFFLLTFGLSWYPWYGGLGAEVLALGPSVAAIVIVVSVNGTSGLADLLRPFLRWRVGLRWWAIAVFGVVVLYLAGVGVNLVLGGELPPFTIIREEARLLPVYLFLVVLAPWNDPVGEEFGWRGFALPRLQASRGPLVASLTLGTVWGLWHLPTFFAPSGVLAAMYAAVGLAFLVPYTVTTIANSIIMTWLYNRTGGSALVAGIVWHAATIFWAPILLSDGSLAAAADGTHLPTIGPQLYLSVAAVLAIAALVLVIATRGRLGLDGST